ncbi:hypothetical protein [Fredinandcohnia sp. 179-A 10B2 NHS]|uniref:hypothetical protein n=1 Tax=Fredinandcohnia sp. 179-A 10B2 NHS TaxID=3235176 RepID=UPI00399FDAFF
MNLPTILAGPILRRVERSCVYIWIALRKRYHLGATLYTIEENDESTINYTEIDCQSETTTIRAGKQLYISLIKVTPRSGMFPTDLLIGYNLFFKSGTTILDLQDFDLLNPNNPNSIVYGNLVYPSFYIPGQIDSQILYGSCRKLHGKGTDALSTSDKKLATTFNVLGERPNALFLVGDQIYADDVPDPVFPLMVEAGKMLIGKKENLATLDSRLNNIPFTQSIEQIRGRQFIMERFCRFTSSHAHNHAMTMGEYSALYLLSWSPQLWDAWLDDQQFPTFQETLQNNNVYFVYDEKEGQDDEQKRELEQHQKRYEEHLKDVKKTYQTLSNVRRLLANIPTYMIFDDHDITDDWNLSYDWKKSVHSSNLGRHIITNGLSAYWLFQGWGNDPDSFHSLFIRNLGKYFKSYNLQSSVHDLWEQQLLEYDAWNFVAPTNPTSIFLDTRTQRAFDHNPLPVKLGRTIEEKDRPPKLIGRHGWETITNCLINSLWKKGDPLIIVSPAPVYGIGLIESFLHQYIYPLKIVGVRANSTFDFEAWKYNGEGFTELLNQFKDWNPSDCIILSGDVHYASAVRSNVTFQTGEKLRIHQFTSSPQHNMSFSGFWGAIMKAVVTLNAGKRRNKEINRYSDDTFHLITQSKDTPCPSNFTWQEKIRYLTGDKSTIIETDNNIGLLRLTPSSIQNFLLQHDRTITYNEIELMKGSTSK